VEEVTRMISAFPRDSCYTTHELWAGSDLYGPSRLREFRGAEMWRADQRYT
jgi:hypothetical protein